MSSYKRETCLKRGLFFDKILGLSSSSDTVTAGFRKHVGYIVCTFFLTNLYTGACPSFNLRFATRVKDYQVVSLLFYRQSLSQLLLCVYNEF